LFLCAVEEAPQQTDDYFFKKPFQDLPQHEFIFVAEKLGVLAFRTELQPTKIVNLKSVEERNLGEHLEAVELNELENLLV